MATSTLSPLVGQRVIATDVVHDYLQVRFENGDLLNVYNVYELQGKTGAAQIGALVGLRVDATTMRKDAVRIECGALTLRMDLADASFSGPEALEYRQPGGIWAVVLAGDADDFE